MEKRIFNLSFIYITILLSIPNLIFGQSDPKKVSDEELTKVAKEIIDQANNCALISLDVEGNPRVRIMDPFKPEKDFIIWFGTNPKSRKVIQIKSDSRVTLYYVAEDNSGYVTILGEAQIIDDSAEKEKRWKEKWKAFYPNYPEGYALIKVTPKSMEVISITHNILGDTITWLPPAIEFD